MSLKSGVKRVFLGKAGTRVYSIKKGLLRGLKFHVDPSCKAMRLMGFDEREIVAATRSFASRSVCALDIGANDGWYSLFFASRTNIQKVYAFEPVPELQQDLRSNFALNDKRWLEKLETVPKLVGNKNEGQWCSIDALLPDLPRPVVFKIDVDGGEMDVFRGAVRTLSGDGCRIVLETHSLELERECKQFLEGLHYKTQIIGPGWYRKILPEGRTIPHNRWMLASREETDIPQ